MIYPIILFSFLSLKLVLVFFQIYRSNFKISTCLFTSIKVEIYVLISLSTRLRLSFNQPIVMEIGSILIEIDRNTRHYTYASKTKPRMKVYGILY